MRDAGSLLVRAGLIDSDALAQARADRAKGGGTLAEHLVLAGVVEDDELTQFFRERLMVPRVSSDRLRAVPKAIIARIPAELASELRVVPVALDTESSLTVAMSDPSDTHALDELEFFTEHYVVRAVASQRQISWCLDHYYGIATPLLTSADVASQPFIDVVTTPFIESKTTPFGDAASEPFIDAATEPFAKKRPGRVSQAVLESRHRVIPPPTAPPPVRGKRLTNPMEATLEDLAASEGLNVGDQTDLDIRPPADYILVLDDDDLDDDREGELEVDHPEIELDADEPDSAAVTQALADGSPGELAPRVGEVLVNVASDRNIGSGPAVVLDDSVFKVGEAGVLDAGGRAARSSEHLVAVDRTDADVGSDTDDWEPEPPEPFDLVDEDEDEDSTTARRLETPTPDDDDEEATRVRLPSDADEEPTSVRLPSDADEEPTSVRLPSEGKLHERLETADEDEATTLVIQLEAEMPESDGVVVETIERGTDSAPILLSEIKRAVEVAENKAAAAKPAAEPAARPQLEIEPVDDDVDESSVVLLEMPKRPRRSTEIGVAPATASANVLNLRRGNADEPAAASLRDKPETEPPVIIDDQDRTATLPELDAHAIEAPDEATAIWQPAPEAAPSSSLSGIEAAAVAELDASWGSALDDQDGDRDRVLSTLESLARADHRDEIVAAVLDYLDHYCDRVVFLALRSGALEPFQIRSSQPLKAPKTARLPLREVSLLRDIVDTRLPYRGPLEDEPSQRLLLAVFGDLSPDGLALPVAVRGRVVGLLYGDGISASLSGDSVGLVTQAAGRALERSLKQAQS